jgi:hypothetical protein
MKRRKKLAVPKPRLRQVVIDLGEANPVDEVRLYLDGRLELRYQGMPRKPSQARADISYDRPKGAKVQSRSFSNDSLLPTHPNQILERADRIFWVDTSSHDSRGRRIHTTATIAAEPHSRTATHTEYRFTRSGGLEFHGDIDRPEALAWAEFMERLRRHPDVLPQWTVCLVVDSDLERLSSINARTTPIWGDYFLPSNFCLVYASADIGKSEPLNAMMRRCDADSRRLFEVATQADQGALAALQQSLIGGPPVRIWNPQDAPTA